jgi:hypothetical protein
MSRFREQECEIFEQKLLETEDPGHLLHDPALAGHLDSCRSCSELCRDFLPIRAHLEAYKVRELPGPILEKVLAQAHRVPHLPRAELPVRTNPGWGWARVFGAGLAALPIVILINTVMGWALYEFAVSVLPRSVALYCVGLFVLWASLGISLSYASLPFLSLIPGSALHAGGIPPGGHPDRRRVHA